MQDTEKQLLAELLTLRVDKLEERTKKIKELNDIIKDTGDIDNIRRVRASLIDLRNDIDNVVKFLNFMYYD